MGKLLKITAAVLGALVLLLVAAVIILPLIIDPNDYKDDIVEQVKKTTGRDLQIAGDIGLSVFPWFGLELAGLQLSNAPGFGDEPFASVGEAAVRVKLAPLLDKELEVDAITLKGLQLNLAKAKDGRTNWDDLAAAGEAKAAPGAEEKGEAASAKPLAAVAIGGVSITDARLSWWDQSRGQQFVVDQFNLKTGAVTPGKPVDLELGFVVDSKEPALKAEVHLDGSPLVAVDGSRVDIKKLNLKLDAEGEALQGKALHARLETGVALDLEAQTLALDGLQLSAADLSVSGQLKGVNLQQAPAFSGELKLAELDLRQWLTAQGLPVPQTTDPKALSRVAMTTQLQASDKDLSLDKLALTLDDSRLDGNVKVQNFAQPAIGFNLTLDAIDLDRYLPPPAEGEEQPAAGSATPQPASAAQASAPQAGKAQAPQATTAAAEPELLPVETLRQLNMDGVFHIGRLVVKKLQAEQVEVKVQAKDGVIKVDKQIKRFYDGSLNGQVDINVKGKSPRLKVDENLAKVQAGPLLKDLAGEERLSGEGRFQTSLTTEGNTDGAMRRNLNGNLEFRFENGAVKGINLAQIIRDTKARFQGQPVAQSNEPIQTDFSELGGTAVIQNGVLTNKDLLAKSPYLRVTGAGTVNLPAEALDYELKTVIVAVGEGQGGRELEELKGIPIPVRVKGSFAEPSYSVNWAEVLAGTQKAKIEEKKAEVKEKIEEKLQDKLKGFGGFLR